MESMNFVTRDDQTSIVKVMPFKCPQCQSTNSRISTYQNQYGSEHRYYCNDCRESWTENREMMDISFGGGERERQQQDNNSAPDHARMALKCPRCGSMDTKFSHYRHTTKSKPIHFCKSCRCLWTVGGKLKASAGEWKRQQPELSIADQDSMSQVAQKCPRCESTKTRLFGRSVQNVPKPVRFCENCRKYWTVGGSLRKERQRKDSGLQVLVEGTGSQAACKGTTEVVQTKCTQAIERQHLSLCFFDSDNRGQDKTQQFKGSGKMASVGGKREIRQVALKCPRCESDNTKFFCHSKQNVPKPVHFCNNCQRYWTAGGSLRTKRKVKDSGLQASLKGQEETGQCEGSCEMTSIGGSESNAACNEAFKITYTDVSRSFSCSAQGGQPVSVCLEKINFHKEKDSEGSNLTMWSHGKSI